MDPQYDHNKYEAEIYKKWEKSGAFTPKADKKKNPFTIIMPPPNANDPLHIGHARFVAIEDVLIRYHRMRGDSTLWLPGADHAGIETQYVFEKKLRDKGQSRFDFDRDTLYKMIWNYVEDNTGLMQSQLKRLGASCDWTRFKFTLDPDIVTLVHKSFKRLFDEGLIYRGKRLVNYCTHCGTAYSNLEVDYVERKDPLYYMKYGPFTLATTRPETKFGDTAVAVNPKDKRYESYLGKEITVKGLIGDFKVRVIADDLVDPEFGTGVVKVTPAHDFNDFEMGERHNLEVKQVIGIDGKLNGLTGKYAGLYVNQARKQVAEDLEKAGMMVKVDNDYTHVVGTCYRCKNTIEPMLLDQWFLKVKPMVDKSLAAMKKGDVKFAVKKYEKIAKNWYENLKDWNISRQIVWGIRIPAWRCEKCSEWTVTDGPAPKKCMHCGDVKLIQDEDTFDTWFSSGQWPYATLKTTKPGDFEYFYPTSVMETAYDILPFWVIRMIMFGVYMEDKVPFNEVLIHGLVRDKNGQKISKSKGNVINPIEMADKHGADALRMGILWGALVENDVALAEENINAQKKFCNKVWNAARFVQGFEGRDSDAGIVDSYNLFINNLVKDITKLLDQFKLNQAVEILYKSFWNNFCDMRIEDAKKGLLSKSDLNNGLLIYLKLLHPFMPFVTEEIWNQIGQKEPLIVSSWPLTFSS
jgi:valyl-tRNA synthetase